jgi:hypothetical protein
MLLGNKNANAIILLSKIFLKIANILGKNKQLFCLYVVDELVKMAFAIKVNYKGCLNKFWNCSANET